MYFMAIRALDRVYNECLSFPSVRGGIRQGGVFQSGLPKATCADLQPGITEAGLCGAICTLQASDA